MNAAVLDTAPTFPTSIVLFCLLGRWVNGGENIDFKEVTEEVCLFVRFSLRFCDGMIIG